MGYLPDTGISAQKLAASLYKHVLNLRTAQPGELVNRGLDGGREFSFLAKSRDGRELLVSVVEEAQPNVQAPHRASQTVRIAEARHKKCLEAQESRRRKWLGEPAL